MQFICIIVDSNRVQVTLFLTLPSSNENARNKKKMQRPLFKLQSAYIRKSHFFKITTFYSYSEKVSQKIFKIFCESFESMNMILLLTIYVKSEIQDWQFSPFFVILNEKLVNFSMISRENAAMKWNVIRSVKC